ERACLLDGREVRPASEDRGDSVARRVAITQLQLDPQQAAQWLEQGNLVAERLERLERGLVLLPGGAASSRSGWLGRGCGCVSAAAGHAEIESAATRTRAPRSPGLCRLLIGQVPEVHAQRDVIAGDDLRVLDEGTEAPAPDRPND